MSFNSFTEMPVWQKANNLSVDIFNLSVQLPRSEDYGLTSQIRRSSNSVSSNISEAFGRKTSKDKSFLNVVSRANCYETQNHLIYGNKVGYFEKDVVEEFISLYNEIIHDINKIINSLN